MTILPVTEFRVHALETVRRVKALGDEVIITAKGKPTAVLVSFDDWESMMETLEIKRDKRLMAQIRASQRYFRKGGKGIPLEKVDWGRI